MMADIRILQVQAQEMQNLVSSMNQAVSDALKAINTRLTEQSDATRKSFADQKLIIDTVSNDLRVVREKLDDNNVRVGTLTQEVDSLRELITSMPRAAAAAPEAFGAGLPPDLSEPAPTPPAGGGTLGASPQRVWEAAMSDYYAGDLDLAVSGFSSYVASFPKAERADDAQLYIGHSYYTHGKYDRAIEAYSTLIRTYPTSDVLPDAYYRLGESYRSLKQIDEARQAFDLVIKTYPASTAATQAQQALQRLQEPR
jgi:tol-pal system protein YbgF